MYSMTLRLTFVEKPSAKQCYNIYIHLNKKCIIVFTLCSNILFEQQKRHYIEVTQEDEDMVEDVGCMLSCYSDCQFV